MAPLSSPIERSFYVSLLPNLSSSSPRATCCEFRMVSSVFSILRLSIQAVCARMAASGSYSSWLIGVLLLSAISHSSDTTHHCTQCSTIPFLSTAAKPPDSDLMHIMFLCLNSIHLSPQRPRPVLVIRSSELSQCPILILLEVQSSVEHKFMILSHWFLAS